ncbi:uncharacterized protein DS421_6g179040 [Arachis hypogaea]|nr:uncharacterized protein DS421_6g179040 [Arachis hypogaea]
MSRIRLVVVVEGRYLLVLLRLLGHHLLFRLPLGRHRQWVHRISNLSWFLTPTTCLFLCTTLTIRK